MQQLYFNQYSLYDVKQNSLNDFVNCEMKFVLHDNVW